MSITEHAKLEDTLLALLDEAAAPAADILKAFNELAVHAPAKAVEIMPMLQDSFEERGDIYAMIKLFALVAAAAKDLDKDPAFQEKNRNVLAKMADNSRDRRMEMLLKHAGFDKALSLSESLRRLELLRALAPGALCMDRSRGFGVVAQIDDFAQQVVVDYEARRGHRLGLSYAAECLSLLAENHLFAIRHHRPEHIARLVTEQPVEIVKMAIRDFGPMAAPQLQDILCAGIVPAEKWKTFWESARKSLKADPLVAMPAKRSEPIKLLDDAHCFDARWFEELAQERDLGVILERVDALLKDAEPETLTPEQRSVVLERLVFVADGAFLSKPEWRVAAIIVASRFGAESEAWLKRQLMSLLELDSWTAAMQGAPVRLIAPLFALLFSLVAEAAGARIRESILDLPVSLLDAATEKLISMGQGSLLDDALKNALASQRMPAELMLWIARRPEIVLERGLLSEEALTLRCLSLLEEGLGPTCPQRVFNHLREQMLNPEWWTGLLSGMGREQRHGIIERLHRSSAWQFHERRAIFKGIVDVFPEMREAVETRHEPAPEPAVEKVTSLRSYQERQKLLQKIINEDIPKASRDIATALEYGDLRENFEYHAAKEAQARLLRRQEELDRELAEVRPVSFGETTPDVAGPGAQVTIRRANGEHVAYTILGEWDNNEELAVISQAAALARALSGHRAGETVEVPSLSGTSEPCVIEAVGPIPKAVREWLDAAI